MSPPSPARVHRTRRVRLPVSLVAAATVLTLATGCAVSGTTRHASDPADATIAQQNLEMIGDSLRSYAIVDDEFAPGIAAHLFGIPGLRSLSTATESAVLAAIEDAGSFGDRAAYSPVLTDPALRAAPEHFIAAPDTVTADPTRSADPLASHLTATQRPAEAPAPDGPDALDIGNEILTAGGDFLISRLRIAGPGGDSKVSVFVTDIAADDTFDLQDLVETDIDPAAVTVDESRTLLVDGSRVGHESLSERGEAVVAALRTPVSRPADSDDRSPDYSCSLLPCVALTYDDGPGEPEVEDALLDAAAEARVRLTYFLLGKNVTAFPGTVERMVAEGHEIANHTHSHPQLDRSSAEAVRTQVRLADDAIEGTGANRPQLLRPPYGALDPSSARALGHPAILWDVDTEDWRHKDAKKVVESVSQEAGPGSIVLMHSIHPSTAKAAPEVFAAVAEKGLYAVTVSELFAGMEFVDGARYFCRGYGQELCSSPEHPAVMGR